LKDLIEEFNDANEQKNLAEFITLNPAKKERSIKHFETIL